MDRPERVDVINWMAGAIRVLQRRVAELEGSRRRTRTRWPHSEPAPVEQKKVEQVVEQIVERPVINLQSLIQFSNESTYEEPIYEDEAGDKNDLLGKSIQVSDEPFYEDRVGDKSASLGDMINGFINDRLNENGVGGQNDSLGEMISQLPDERLRIPCDGDSFPGERRWPRAASVLIPKPGERRWPRAASVLIPKSRGRPVPGDFRASINDQFSGETSYEDEDEDVGTPVYLAGMPKEPKQPPSAYFIFVQESRCTMAGGSLSEVAARIVDKWGGMTAEERTVYEEKARALRGQYDTEMAEYKSSVGRSEDTEDDMPVLVPVGCFSSSGHGKGKGGGEMVVSIQCADGRFDLKMKTTDTVAHLLKEAMTKYPWLDRADFAQLQIEGSDEDLVEEDFSRTLRSAGVTKGTTLKMAYYQDTCAGRFVADTEAAAFMMKFNLGPGGDGSESADYEDDYASGDYDNDYDSADCSEDCTSDSAGYEGVG